MLKSSWYLSRFLIFLLITGLLGTSPAFAAQLQAPAVTYYVSSSAGNDANNGLSEGTAFATVGKVNALNLQPGDSVLFKCGDTWRGQMLTITKSGAAGSPITIGSYPANCANRPILSGAQPISGWALHSGNIYAASLNAGANAGKFTGGVNQLFRGDTRLLLGRWPNLDAADGGYSTIESQPGSNQIRDDQLPSVNWAGAVAHIKGMRWYILNRQVTGSSGTTLTFGSNNDCWAGNCAGWGYFLNNHISTLDRDGEWYYDATAQKVYLYTTAGAPANGQVEGSVILKNDERSWGGVTIGEDLVGQGPSYVTVKNLDVRRWFRSGIAIPTNFAHYEPHHLVIENNVISDVDEMGIDLATWVYDAWDGRPDGWRGGYNLTVSGNTITRANSMGINLYSRNSTFSENTIQDVGLIENLGTAGMGCSFSAGGGSCTEDGNGIRIKIDQSEDTGHTNLITGNHLERIAYNGMDIFGHHNTIEQNVIIQACYAKGDCGGVRTFGRDNLDSSPVHDLTFNANIILDTIGNTDGCKSDFDALFGFGLYIDHYSRDVVVTGNTVINSTVHGILFQDSTGSVTNNTLYNNGRTYPYGGGQVYLGGAPAALSAHTGNILYSLNSNAWTLALATPANLGTSNNNFFFSPYKANHISASGAKSLTAWQSFSGKDGASLEHWFTLTPGSLPNSQIFYNDTDQTKTISLGSAVYKDVNQNFVSGDLTLQPYQSKVLIASNSIPIVVSSVRANANPAEFDNVDFIVTFSEPVTGVDITDFSLATIAITGASVTGLSGSGNSYIVSVDTGSGSGTLRLDVPATATIVDLDSYPLSGLPYTGGEAYTIPLPPFNKISPPIDATNQSLSPTLSWNVSDGATSYEYCYSSAPGPCTQWHSVGANTSVTLNDLAADYTYSWQVRAVNAYSTTEADGGTWWSFTTTAASACTWPAYTPPASATFGDVPMTVGHWSWVERLANATITAGCGAGNYCPFNEVNRAQMAIFLLRGKHCGSSYTPPAVGASTGFNDVPLDATYAPWVKQLAAEGVTAGCGNGNFCPLTVVNRAQMAIFLLRAKHGSTYSPPAVGATTGFADVPLDATYAAWVKQLAAEGVTAGCGNGNFCPLQNVNRAQMATFLVRAFGLP